MTTQATYDCAPLLADAECPYSLRYEGYIGFWTLLCTTPHTYLCSNVPATWAPLVAYLGHSVTSVSKYGHDYENVDWSAMYHTARDKRHAVEVVSTLRPELVHALYIIDTCGTRTYHVRMSEFPVTSNGSFFRCEVLRYIEKLRTTAFSFKHDKVILTSCSADKPAPSSTQQAVLDLAEKYGYELMVVSGTIGICPEALWGTAPKYDAGLPNHQRVEQVVEAFFVRNTFKSVVSYVDFYAQSTSRALTRAGQAHTNIFGDYFRDTYSNLSAPENLNMLEGVLKKEADALLTKI